MSDAADPTELCARIARGVMRNPPLAMVFAAQFAVGATLPQMELYVRDLWGGAPELVPDVRKVRISSVFVNFGTVVVRVLKKVKDAFEVESERAHEDLGTFLGQLQAAGCAREESG